MLHRHALIMQQGDPGLFDVFKKIAGGAGRFLAGGGLPGLAFRGVSALVSGPRPGPGPSLPGIGSFTPPVGTFPTGSPLGRTPGFPPQGLAGTGGRTPSIGAQSPQIMSNGCPSGWHPNKSDYHTASGFVAQGTKCVRNRRRNLSNGRANTRALRRMAAWDKQERKLGTTLKKIVRGR